MTAGWMAHQTQKAKRAGTYREPEPRKDDESDKRWYNARKNLRCIQDACPHWLDSLPTFTCTINGERLCLMSLYDMEKAAELCPYSGAKGMAKWNAHLLR